MSSFIGRSTAVFAALTLLAACSNPPPAARLAPIDPAALAVGPNGHLYIADRFRNQILERQPDGSFSVFAGNGDSGYAGDGGPATKAALGRPNGMTFGPDGSLYLADSHNARVRAISAGGVITTVAGSGRSDNCPQVHDGTRAVEASLGNPADVAIGPGGLAYLAVSCNNQILRLNRDGTLTRIAGNRDANARNQGLFGVGRPATEASPDGPLAIEFDAAGNLFIFGFNTKALLMIGTDGILISIDADGFYPRGSGGMARTPEGSVVGTDATALEELSPEGTTEIVDFASIDPKHLNGLVGLLPLGLAIGPDGTIYVSASEHQGSGPGVAIVQIDPGGLPEVIWSRGASISP